VTVLNSEARLGMSMAAMPRVNLLPPEIAEKATLRKVQMGLGAGLLATVGVLGLLYVSAAHSVSEASGSLAQATNQGQQLTAEKGQYAQVTAVYDRAAAAQQQLTTAMGQEVRYSQVLHDLSLSVPSTVWLKSMTIAQTPAATATGATGPVTAGGTAAVAVASPIGTMTFTGVGFDHDDLALWLEALSGLKAYGNPYFSESTEALLGTRKVVNFTSTANLMPAALSGRYNKPLGG
jgi:Tfp pilus assembly protein PilN